MEDIISMTSSELQKNFPDIYKKFFNTHDLVISGNAILTWWVDMSHGVNTLRIKQKLPTKTYCGVNFNNSGKITFRSLHHYSIIDNIFKEDPFNILFKHDTKKMIQFLQYYLVENNFSKGIEIDFLTEAPRWHGFSFSAVISTLISLLLHIITGKFQVESLGNWELSTDHPFFSVVYWLSLNISNYISNGKTSGASNYVTMLTGNPLPIVYFSKKDSTNNSKKEDHELDTYKDMFMNISEENASVYKDTILKFSGIEETISELPIDYGVIFTGMEYTYESIESMRESIKNEDAWLDDFITTMIGTLPIKHEDQIALSDILKINKDETSHFIIKNTNLKILEWFDHLLKHTYNDNAVRAFIDSIRRIWLLSFAYQEENKVSTAITYLFHQYKQFEDEEIGILPFNTGKIWGSLLFVMKERKSRATIQKVLNHLKNDKQIVSLDYTSWRDGYASDGLCIEQYITEKIYSKYANEWSVLFINNFGTSYYGDYDTMVEKEKDCILLDTIWSRIYINGQRLTSKEIHSQNSTIDILTILFENIGREISNSKLPISTYSQNKNEILSKIILPIRKISKTHFWKEIPLICSGGITDYYLRLEQDSSIPIGIIKKLWS